MVCDDMYSGAIETVRGVMIRGRLRGDPLLYFIFYDFYCRVMGVCLWWHGVAWVGNGVGGCVNQCMDMDMLLLISETTVFMLNEL